MDEIEARNWGGIVGFNNTIGLLMTCLFGGWSSAQDDHEDYKDFGDDFFKR